MTVDMVINICFVLFIGNIFGDPRGEQPRLRARAHVRALRLRPAAEDRPNWPRPIKLSAHLDRRSRGLLAVWCLVLTVVGFGWIQIAAGGYGGDEGEDHRLSASS